MSSNGTKGETLKVVAKNSDDPAHENQVVGDVGLPVATKSGRDLTFKLDEEARLAEHFKLLRRCGYKYSRREILDSANAFAISLGRRDREHPLSNKWLVNFMQRWPELHVTRPQSLEVRIAKAASEDVVTSYYAELQKILTDYDLVNAPERIYSIDERNLKVAVSSESEGSIVTVIGGGNALGQQIPPYFVFPGQRMRQALLRGSTPGASGSVSNTGLPDPDLYNEFLIYHFQKYARERFDKDYILVLYDAHRPHVSSLPLIDLAKEHNMLLFYQPAHTSHVLQGIGKGCFGPFETLYSEASRQHIENNSSTINKYVACELACKTYTTTLSPSNLQNSFKQAGIFPLLSGADICKSLISKGPVLKKTPKKRKQCAIGQRKHAVFKTKPSEFNPHFVTVPQPSTFMELLAYEIPCNKTSSSSSDSD